MEDSNENLPATDPVMREMVKEEVNLALKNLLPGIIADLREVISVAVRQEMLVVRQEMGVQARERTNCTLKDFMIIKPKEYDGEIDPVRSRRWIMEMESNFESTKCRDEDRVIFTIPLLTGKAKEWYMILKRERGDLEINTLAWEEFKAAFLKYHCPQAEINKMKEELLTMRQKSESINEIVSSFSDKLQFCPELFSTERAKIDHLYSVLNHEFRDRLIPENFHTLVDFINSCREREVEFRRQEERGEKRKRDVTEAKLKEVIQHPKKKKPFMPSHSRVCESCGKKHIGECSKKVPKCYLCGQKGHIVSQCTSRVQVCYHCFKPGHIKTECPDLQTPQLLEPAEDRNVVRPEGSAFNLTVKETRTSDDNMPGKTPRRLSRVNN